jgi:hypothetical protein
MYARERQRDLDRELRQQRPSRGSVPVDRCAVDHGLPELLRLPMSAQRTLLLLACLVVGLTAPVTWWLTRDVSAESEESAQRGRMDAPSRPNGTSTELPVIPDHPTSSGTGALEPSGVGPEAREEIEFREPTLEEKYSSMTADELNDSLMALDKASHDFINDLANRLREDGGYDLKIVPEGTQVDLPGSFQDGSQRITNVRHSTEGPGLVRMEIVSIRPSDYPELVAIFEEMDWISAQLERLRAR